MVRHRSADSVGVHSADYLGAVVLPSTSAQGVLLTAMTNVSARSWANG